MDFLWIFGSCLYGFDLLIFWVFPMLHMRKDKIMLAAAARALCVLTFSCMCLGQETYHMNYANTCPKSECKRHCKPIKHWADSYEVDGRCYCIYGGSGQDHDIRSIAVTTRIGDGKEVTVNVVRT